MFSGVSSTMRMLLPVSAMVPLLLFRETPIISFSSGSLARILDSKTSAFLRMSDSIISSSGMPADASSSMISMGGGVVVLQQFLEGRHLAPSCGAGPWPRPLHCALLQGVLPAAQLPHDLREELFHRLYQAVGVPIPSLRANSTSRAAAKSSLAPMLPATDFREWAIRNASVFFFFARWARIVSTQDP